MRVVEEVDESALVAGHFVARSLGYLAFSLGTQGGHDQLLVRFEKLRSIRNGVRAVQAALRLGYFSLQTGQKRPRPGGLMLQAGDVRCEACCGVPVGV